MADRARGCFKFGCIGCLVVAGLAVVAAAAVGAMAALSAGREPRMEPIDSAHTRDAPAPSSTEGLATIELGDPRLAEPGHVVLDISLCSFELEPGPPGEPLRLEGNYDAENLEVSEQWEEHGKVGWTYRLRLAKRGIPFLGHHEEGDCEMRLVVPRAMPFTLEGEIGIGESRLELGGLHVLGVDLSTGIGEHEISFDDPVPRPLDFLRVNGSIGELRVVGLGHASPAEVDVQHTLGEASVDLDGDWRNDATISVSCGMGACTLVIPDDTNFAVTRTAMSFGESNFDLLFDREPRPGRPTLTLSLSGKMGEFHIDD